MKKNPRTKPAKGENEIHLVPEWQSATPAELAALWIFLPQGPKYDDPEWTGVLDAVGNLQSLFLPLGALQFYGTAEAIRGKMNVVTNAIAIYRSFPGWIVGTPDGGRRKVSPLDGSEFEAFAANLQRIASRLQEAEKKFQREGWQYDPDAKKIKEIPNGPGNPRGFLARCCVAVYMGNYDGQKLTADVLMGIKKNLSRFILAEYLDDSPKGFIYWSVKNQGVGPHNRKRLKNPKL